MPPKKTTKPKKLEVDENKPTPSTSKSTKVRQGASKAQKRVLKDKNDSDSDSDFSENTTEYATTPKGGKTPETEAVSKKDKKVPNKKSAKPGNPAADENEPTASTSKSTKIRQAAAKAQKRILKEENESDSDFSEDTTEYPTTPKGVSAKKKPKKTPESEPASKKEKKGSAQETRDKNKAIYFKSILTADAEIMNNNDGSRVKNFCTLMDKLKSGRIQKVAFTDSMTSTVVDRLKEFKVWRTRNPFDSRITSICWHPTKPGLACVGSKWGDLVLWDVFKDLFEDKISEDWVGKYEGRGPGGSIQSLKFDEISPNRLYFASIDGTVGLHDFETSHREEYLQTNDWSKWYTGLDVSFSGKTILAGRNNGEVTLLSLDGNEIWNKRLHKSKCNFVQFSDRDKTSTLAVLEHDLPVNSAFFSSMSGDKLLTTDQNSQIRVYQGPGWDLARIIPHPHRQFQHLTAIKATWYPLLDIPVVGRYPDPKFPGYQDGERRTIDFYDSESGECLLNLHQPGLDKIIPLNQFSPTGEFLLSGMASTILIWKQDPTKEENEEWGEEDEVPRRSVPSQPGAQNWPELESKKKPKNEKKKKEADTEMKKKKVSDTEMKKKKK
ncbi:DNA damage-binding protein 2 [Eurytemora carolleeae]|uniref:DNA damage-binding protein 2 n=1 Tax=Eurytemora carolleeae TaxID=1294199 RepID=UPI000C76EA7C|nr:DNA damage-binding protein 2 [Eurytemora carolleeae]|eukprot:XP_023339508.1 DNA damage-binding protein 2-like [Eurytemora affinis]